MREQIDVIFKDGVFQPLIPVPGQFREHQHYTVTIEGINGTDNWLADADQSVSLEAVRQVLAKVSLSLAQAVADERAER